jgi:hypothetical protein
MFVFQIFGSFRLLIQRCKNVTGRGSLFDQGGDWLDESKNCPTKGFWRVGGLRPPGGNGGGRMPGGGITGAYKGGHGLPARRAIIKRFAAGAILGRSPRRIIKPPRVFSAAAIFLSGLTMLKSDWVLPLASSRFFRIWIRMMLHGSDGFALGFSGHRLTSFQWMIGFKRAFRI